MGKTLKTALICLAANMLVVVFMVSNSSGFLIGVRLFWVMALLMQFILGLAFALEPKRKEIGKGLLLGTALAILIGYSVCSGFAR